MDRLPGVCVVFVLSKHKLLVLVTSPAEPMGSTAKENINMGVNTSTVGKKKKEREKERGRDKPGKLMQVSVERKRSWQHSRQRVFPGHERLAAPNWDYSQPLGSPSDEQRRQRERCGGKLKET